MITIRSFQEEFYNYLKVYGEDVAVYKNPTSQDIREFQKDEGEKQCRFVLLRSSSLVNCFIWTSDILHYKMAQELKISYPENPIALFGIAKITSSYKLEAAELLSLEEMIDKYTRVDDPKLFNLLVKLFQKPWKNKYVDSVDKLAKKIIHDEMGFAGYLDDYLSKVPWLK